MNKIKRFEAMARDMVGDGKKPNIFFVTYEGVVVTITRDLHVAYNHWHQLASRAPFKECALEDRRHGVLASVEPVEDGSSRLVKRDDVSRLSWESYARCI
jgi:hypothetical protein